MLVPGIELCGLSLLGRGESGVASKIDVDRKPQMHHQAMVGAIHFLGNIPPMNPPQTVKGGRQVTRVSYLGRCHPLTRARAPTLITFP